MNTNAWMLHSMGVPENWREQALWAASLAQKTIRDR
jgi:hypothetical protein